MTRAPCLSGLRDDNGRDLGCGVRHLQHVAAGLGYRTGNRYIRTTDRGGTVWEGLCAKVRRWLGQTVAAPFKRLCDHAVDELNRVQWHAWLSFTAVASARCPEDTVTSPVLETEGYSGPGADRVSNKEPPQDVRRQRDRTMAHRRDVGRRRDRFSAAAAMRKSPAGRVPNQQRGRATSPSRATSWAHPAPAPTSSRSRRNAARAAASVVKTSTRSSGR